MEFLPTNIPDVKIVRPTVFSDARGFFFESFQSKKFADVELPSVFVQDNHSGSRKGTLRGLHYQIRQPQGKLVRTVVGEIFDVAVDIRRSSPTFGQWVGVNLSAENRQQLWIPVGFAHGYYVLSDWAEILYKATDYYAPEWERTIIWNDSRLNIKWPLDGVSDLLLSAKDQLGKPFDEAEYF